MNAAVRIGDREFGADEIISVTGKQKLDPLYGGLPEGEMVVELYTREPLEPQREEPLVLLVNGLTKMTMFVKKCTRIANCHYRLLAKPRTEYLQTKFIGKLYEDSIYMYEILPEIFGDRSDNILTESVYFDQVKGYIGPGSRAHVLQQLSVGIGAMLACGEAGDLTFKKPLAEDPKVLTKAQLTAARSQVLLPHYSCYELVSHEYVKGQVDKTVIDKEEYLQGQVVIPFHSPHWGYSSTGDGEYNCEILDCGSNFVEVLHSPGPLIIYARPWLDQTVYYTLPGVESEDAWFSHVLSIRDMTLIGPHNVEERLQQLKTLGQLRCQLTVGCLDDLEGPRPGDRVSLPEVQGIVTGEKVILKGGRLYRELTVLC